MVKIVNGLKYDTSKSDVIYEDKTRNRTYYMTKAGRFFVVYNKTQKLEPMSEDEMKAFLAENDPEKYEELFGEVEEA